MTDIRKQITDIFGGLEKKSGEKIVKVAEQDNPRWQVKKKDLANQAHVELAWPAMNVSDQRRFPLAVLVSYLGQGLSSRLFIELREKRGLCYAVGAGANHLKDVGTVGVSAGLNIDKLEEAIDGVASEIRRLKDRKLTAKELEESKEKIRGPMLFAMENPVRVMEFYARQALDKPEDILTPGQLIEKVMAVDVESVQKIACELFVENKINLAVVGPVAEERVEKIVKSIKI